jgi:hypothetical protein
MANREGTHCGVQIRGNKVVRPMGKASGAKDAKMNIWPRGIVEGFRLAWGMELYFEMFVCETPRPRSASVARREEYEYDIYFGNMQIRASPDSWREAWKRAHEKFFQVYKSYEKDIPAVPAWLLPVPNTIDDEFGDERPNPKSVLDIVMPDSFLLDEEDEAMKVNRDLCETLLANLEERIEVLNKRKRYCQEVIAAASSFTGAYPARWYNDYLSDVDLRTSYLTVPPEDLPKDESADSIIKYDKMEKIPVIIGDPDGEYQIFQYLPKEKAQELYSKKEIDAMYKSFHAYQKWKKEKMDSIEANRAKEVERRKQRTKSIEDMLRFDDSDSD